MQILKVEDFAEIIKLGYLHFFRRQRFGYISFCIGLKYSNLYARF